MAHNRVEKELVNTKATLLYMQPAICLQRNISVIKNSLVMIQSMISLQHME